MTTVLLFDLESILTRHGLAAGLRFLNQRVAHRVTAIYKLENSVMRLVDVVDKQNDLTTSSLPEVPLEDSFCQFAIRDKHFMTGDTAKDTRLDGHNIKASWQATLVYRSQKHLENFLARFATTIL